MNTILKVLLAQLTLIERTNLISHEQAKPKLYWLIPLSIR